MKRVQLPPFMGLLVVGITATLALLLEVRLPVSDEIHFLLQLLWLGVAMGALFMGMLHAAFKQEPAQKQDKPETDIPEWRDSDRIWLQQHPDDFGDDATGIEGTPR